jgi:glycosyltransferase involved in cell wall biosynthesis
MPKLLIDGTALARDPKGVGRYSYKLIEQLVARLDGAWSFIVVVFDVDLPEFERADKLSIVRVPKVPDLVKGLVIIPWLVVQLGVDVVLLPMEAAVLTAGRPTLAVLHDIDALIVSAGRQQRSVPRRIMHSLQQHFRIRMLRDAFVVICNSAFTAEAATIRYRVRRDRIAIGYCGVDERFYSDDDAHIREWCGPVRFWQGYVLTIATGDPRERYDLCPAVWAAVRAALPNIGLVVAGVRRQQRYAADLKNEFTARGLIEGRDYTFVDFIGENEFGKLRSLYRHADFYLELSAHEGFGMQLAEAMATGTTCISSGRGALAEIAGGHAVEIDALEPKQIADRIVEAYRHGFNTRDNSAQVAYTKRFSWDSVGALVVNKLADLSHRLQPKGGHGHPTAFC